MSDSTGVYSVFDSINFATHRTKQSIETIRNYNKMMATYLPAKTSQADGLTFLSNSALITPNFETQRSFVNNPKTLTGGNSFCLALTSGLLNSQEPIPLSDTWGLGGLELTINLSPDANVFYSEDDSSASFTNAFYELSELSLVAETVVPDADTLARLNSSPSNTFEFNTISTFYQTINSTNAVVNLNLGQSNVLGVFGSFVPVTFLNNMAQNGMLTSYPMNAGNRIAEIKSLVFNRANERFPLHYNIDTPQRDDSRIEVAPADIVKNFLDSLDNFVNIQRTSVSPSNTRVVGFNGSGLPYKSVAEGGLAAGIGVCYDKISGNGVNFQNVPFTLQIESDLTTDNPNALYLFVHARNTMVSSNGSVQIMN
tara:strand:- start:5157 stop:6263 length:1107 start_codon:yes stop_codon:yes gene_type:complete